MVGHAESAGINQHVVGDKKEIQSVVLRAFFDLIDANAAWIRKKAKAPEHI